MLSHDPEFTVKGEATSILYQKDFKFYLKLLLHPDRRRWTLEVIDFFNTGVFGTKSPGSQSADNPTGVPTDIRSWEDELLLEIGNDFEPELPTFRSHPPSEHPISNPGPGSLSGIMNTTSAIVREPPAPLLPLPGPVGAPSDSGLDGPGPGGPPVSVPLLAVNAARPRPRLHAPSDFTLSISAPQAPDNVHAVNELEPEIARLSINPQPDPVPSAPKSSRHVRAITSSGSRSKVGAVAAYPGPGALNPNELGEILNPASAVPVGRTTRSRKKAAN